MSGAEEPSPLVCLDDCWGVGDASGKDDVEAEGEEETVIQQGPGPSHPGLLSRTSSRGARLGPILWAHCRKEGQRSRTEGCSCPSSAALKGDSNLYSSLPLTKREEVEKLLKGSAGDTWRHLAGELGYQPEHIDSFTHETCPVRALMASWGAQDSATLDALLAALRRIQRADIVESLCSESTATSPV